MEKTLGYLREALSNYIEEHSICQEIYEKLEQKNYSSEEEFVKDLGEGEIKILDLILKQEIKHAQQEQDEKRTQELNEVSELLF
ncbi:sporulation protein [Alkalihalobacillus sp. BA299]|uniref:sporulation protein n=1 Tax=Alkalihalobacillus sp. BA299 TaxID=2815938 RepID=UPI001ADD0824|nr:sporulation protein [Alkalihalobacillus sp. BA299]